jgi:hypothetical protein
VTVPEDVPPAWTPYVAAPRSPGAPTPYREYGAPTEATVRPAPRSGHQGVALLAGAAVALAGALLWAAAAFVTGYQSTLVAVVLGQVVGITVHRVAGAAARGTAACTALLAGGGILLGFALVAVSLLARARDLTYGEALRLASSQIGWATLLDRTMSTISWVCLVAGTWFAWMRVARFLRPERR